MFLLNPAFVGTFPRRGGKRNRDKNCFQGSVGLYGRKNYVHKGLHYSSVTLVIDKKFLLSLGRRLG